MERTKFEITIGVEYDRDNRRITPKHREAALDKIKDLAALHYGGYTMVQGTGGWHNDAGELVQEHVVILTIVVNRRDTESTRSDVLESAARYGQILNQDSIVVAKGSEAGIYKV